MSEGNVRKEQMWRMSWVERVCARTEDETAGASLGWSYV